jgi:hypothetical protein
MNGERTYSDLFSNPHSYMTLLLMSFNKKEKNISAGAVMNTSKQPEY